jgi:hypothetical protein
MGKYDLAAKYYQESCTIMEQLFGEHPEVAQNQNDLAWIYFKQAR